GGTWLGLNERGLFVGVTNRFGVPRDERRESRGKLVLEALAAPSARALHERLAALSPNRFNAFHLFYADRFGAYVTSCDGEEVHQAVLAAGVHTGREGRWGGDDPARPGLIRSKWRERAPPTADEQDVAKLLRLHASNPIGGTCIHAPGL